jgi:hypothetical protein
LLLKSGPDRCLHFGRQFHPARGRESSPHLRDLLRWRSRSRNLLLGLFILNGLLSLPTARSPATIAATNGALIYAHLIPVLTHLIGAAGSAFSRDIDFGTAVRLSTAH